MIGVILTVAGFEGVGLVFTGSLILGLVMAFFPALAQRYMKRITGTDDIAFGHSAPWAMCCRAGSVASAVKARVQPKR
jgi:ascorbate-specific PTS system EIIC-type component UlaA